MELIVDVQGFCVPNFTPKEIAILSRDGKNEEHLLIKPPFSWRTLDKKSRKNVKWLYFNHHKLSWDDGLISYGEMDNIIKKILQNASKIYVKGHLKRKFIEKYFDGKIIDLETLPSMKKFEELKYCFHHSPPSVCSMNNTYIIKKMLDIYLLMDLDYEMCKVLKKT